MKKLFLILLIILSVSVNGYCADQWDKTIDGSTTNISDIDSVWNINNEAQDRMLANYRESASIAYSSASSVTVSSGEVACSNSDGSVRKYRKNTSNLATSWTVGDNGLDAGSEAASTTYYVYATCDDDEVNFKSIVSTNSSTPTGYTYYKKIGSFYNDSSSNIDRTKIYTTAYGSITADSSGKKSIHGIYDYGTSLSSFSSKTGGMIIAFGQVVDVGGNSSVTISNLPFTSSSTYSVALSKLGTTRTTTYDPAVVKSSGSSFTITNNHSDAVSGNGTFHWIAVGY